MTLIYCLFYVYVQTHTTVDFPEGTGGQPKLICGSHELLIVTNRYISGWPVVPFGALLDTGYWRWWIPGPHLSFISMFCCTSWRREWTVWLWSNWSWPWWDASSAKNYCISAHSFVITMPRGGQRYYISVTWADDLPINFWELVRILLRVKFYNITVILCHLFCEGQTTALVIIMYVPLSYNEWGLFYRKMSWRCW